MEIQIVGTKISRPRDGRHKNSLPKEWTDGQLNGRLENNLSKDGDLNVRHENNSPKGWTAQT